MAYVCMARVANPVARREAPGGIVCDVRLFSESQEPKLFVGVLEESSFALHLLLRGLLGERVAVLFADDQPMPKILGWDYQPPEVWATCFANLSEHESQYAAVVPWVRGTTDFKRRQLEQTLRLEPDPSEPDD